MLSVLIVNWNSREELLHCLDSLRQFPPTQEHEVIVVDNQSTDGSAESVASLFPEVQLVRADSNLGYASGNNLAFSMATGDYLLTLNPDTVIRAGSLDRAIHELKAHPEAGALGARLVGMDGKTQASVRGFPTVLGIIGNISHIDTLFPRSIWGSYRLPSFDYAVSQWAPQPMGTFLLFRRKALESVGPATAPFDLAFPIFFNEVDLLKRLSLAGWKCWYAAEVVIDHVGAVSTRQARKAMIWESHLSLTRYLRKHEPSWLLPVTGALIWLGAFIRARGFSHGFRP
ncbi:MAG: glycosyltransferase family 2 protein [Fimbriimonadaceae bacterium]|nr:glycosyltransferase family 2 protein [Fimbriimonadaceae bacterium]